MYQQFNWHIGWFWFWAGTVVCVLLVLPLVFGGRYRLVFAALLSTVGFLCICLISWRSIYARDTVGINTGYLDVSGGRELFDVVFETGSGGFVVWFRQSDISLPAMLREPAVGPWVFWSITRPPRYPECRDPVFRRWGFQVTWFGEPPRPGFSSTTRLGAVICPVWFPMPFLLVLPSRYVYRRWLRPLRLRRQNRCLACGYSLIGHKRGARCPECSAVIAESHQAAMVQGTTESRGKQDAAK